MKRSYEHRSNIRSIKIKQPVFIVLILAFFIFLINTFAPNFFSSLFTTIVRPLWHDEEKIGISYELRDALITQLQIENSELKKALNRSTASSTVIAYILKKPPFSAYDSYIIDIGTDHNIQIGDKAYSIGHVLLGEVKEINKSTSKVKLYSSYGEKFDVTIGKDVEATAYGMGGGSFEVSLPRDTKVQERDIVTVPNIKVSVFGIVNKVIIDPVKTFYTILFSQPVNIYEQKYVLIEKNK